MDQKQIDAYIANFRKFEKENPGVLLKAPRGIWKQFMSREEKRYRTRWNTEKRPYTPTPKGDPRKKNEKTNEEAK